tara:strand:+ start:747 stop:1211 length:465 start_codon:yes stop_codon:yes gene_type:complete
VETYREENKRYQIAPEAFTTKPLLPEERLWRSVIINALEDTQITHVDRKSSITKLKAHNWIISNCGDFQDICTWAELQPDIINTHYRGLLKKKVVRFTDKQILWYQYDLFSQTLNEMTDDRQKKAQRRKMKDMRELICQTPGELLSTIFLSVLS